MGAQSCMVSTLWLQFHFTLSAMRFTLHVVRGSSSMFDRAHDAIAIRFHSIRWISIGNHFCLEADTTINLGMAVCGSPSFGFRLPTTAPHTFVVPALPAMSTCHLELPFDMTTAAQHFYWKRTQRLTVAPSPLSKGQFWSTLMIAISFPFPLDFNCNQSISTCGAICLVGLPTTIDGHAIAPQRLSLIVVTAEHTCCGGWYV